MIGNPPFLGGKLMRTVLGDDYVDRLFAAYAGQVPAEADLVGYWFAKAWQQFSSLSAPGGGEGRGEVGIAERWRQVPPHPPRLGRGRLPLPLKGGEGQVRRAGLVATNSIRGGANRRVLDRSREMASFTTLGMTSPGSSTGRRCVYRWFALPATALPAMFDSTAFRRCGSMRT